jgi:hypothetical protein
VGHAARIEAITGTYKFLVGKRRREMLFGKSRLRWECGIKIVKVKVSFS